MGGRGKAVQGPRRLRRQTCAAALVLCGALALTACNGDDGAAGAAGAAPGGSPATSPAPAAPASPVGGATPSASTATSSKKPAPTAATTAPGKPKPPAPGPTCAPKEPISPDEIAVYRYTPEGGMLSLIVKHGHWGCPVAGGATPFVTVGEETFIPVADDAKITAMTPIVTGSVSKPITAQELTSWLESHPNKGLVFHYNVNHRGMIETLGQEEYTS